MTNLTIDRYTDKEYSEIIYTLFALHDYVSIDLLYEITSVDRPIIQNILIDINELLSIFNSTTKYFKLEKSHFSDVFNSKSIDKVKQIDEKILRIHKQISENGNVNISVEFREYINKNCYYHILNNHDSKYISTNLLDSMKSNSNIKPKDYTYLLNTIQRTSFDYYNNKEYDKLIELTNVKVKFVKYLINKFENKKNIENLEAVIDYYSNDKAITILFDMINSMEYNDNTAEEIENYKMFLEKKINNITDYNLRMIFTNLYSIIQKDDNEKPKDLLFGTSILMGISYQGFQDISDIFSRDLIYEYNPISIPKDDEINEIILSYNYPDDGLLMYSGNNDDITSVEIAKREAFFDNFTLEYIIECTIGIIFDQVYTSIYNNKKLDDTSELDEFFNNNLCENFRELYSNDEIKLPFLAENIMKLYNDFKIDADPILDEIDEGILSVWRKKMSDELQEALFKIWLAQTYMNKISIMDVINHKYYTYSALIFSVVFSSIYNNFDFDKYYNYIANDIPCTNDLDFQHYIHLLNTHFYIKSHIFSTDTNVLYKQISNTYNLIDCSNLEQKGKYIYLISVFNNKEFSIQTKIKKLRDFYKDSRYICDCNVCRCQERLDGYFMDAAVSHLAGILYRLYKDNIMELILELESVEDCVIECRRNYKEKVKLNEEIQEFDTSCLEFFKDILVDINESMWQVLKDGNKNTDIKFVGKKAEWIRILNNLVNKENLLQSDEFLNFYYLMGRYNIFNVNYFIDTAFRPNGYDKCLEQYIIGNLDYVLDNNCDVTIRQINNLGRALSTTEIISNEIALRKYDEIIKINGYRPIGKKVLEAQISFANIPSEYNLYSVIKSSYRNLSDFKFEDIRLIYNYIERLYYPYYNYLTDIFEVIFKFLFNYTDDRDAKEVRLKYAYKEFADNYSEAFSYNIGCYDCFNSVEAVFSKILLKDYSIYDYVLDIIDESGNRSTTQDKIEKTIIYYTLEYHYFYEIGSTFLTLDADKRYYDSLLIKQLNTIEDSNMNESTREQILVENCYSILGRHDCSIELLKKCLSILENLD